MILNYYYIKTINCLMNGLEEKIILNYYTERAGMDGNPPISIRYVIIRAKQ